MKQEEKIRELENMLLNFRDKVQKTFDGADSFYMVIDKKNVSSACVKKYIKRGANIKKIGKGTRMEKDCNKMFAYIMYEYIGWTHGRIAREMDITRTTVTYHIKTHKELYEWDKQYIETFNTIFYLLKQNIFCIFAQATMSNINDHSIRNSKK